MANKNALNKNSVYVQSLVEFLLDTKPYHSKLTEIVEEYRFFDDVRVGIDERLTSRTKINPVNVYNYFSGANPMYRTMPAKRLVSPSFSTDAYRVGQDENKDLALVPFVYSKKSFDGEGVSGVFVTHGETTERLAEGVDFFHNQGSFQFQIKQTLNANGVHDPLWSSTADDSIVAHARQATRVEALNVKNESSAVRRIKLLLDQIKQAVEGGGGHDNVERELFLLYGILDAIYAAWAKIDAAEEAGEDTTALYFDLYSLNLPQSYEALLNWLAIPNEADVIIDLAPHSLQWYKQQFSINSSPLFFGMFTDMGLRESGRIDYPTAIENAAIRVTNVRANADSDIEEWTLTGQTNGTYRVSGSTVGFVGFALPGQLFTSFRVSFNIELLGTVVDGDTLRLTPTRKILIGKNAPLETWNIIKTSPLAHSRPILSSTRYGYIRDESGKIGSVTILDKAFSGDVILTANGNGTFKIEGDGEYRGQALVGVPFNDGRLGFTIVDGSLPFVKGERFYATIENKPPVVENLDLGFGYDFDPYDGNDEVDDLGNALTFLYDTRITNYDLSQLNVEVKPGATNGRKWRARAHRVGGERLIKTIPGRLGSLLVFEANLFLVESSDDDFMTTTSSSTIAIGERFDSPEVSFTLVRADRPFIAVVVPADSAPGTAVGGDVLSFSIGNPDPVLVEEGISLSSIRIPQLSMYSNSFHKAVDADWLLEFVDSTNYRISAWQNGNEVVAAIDVSLKDGFSFKSEAVHFTVIPGAGLGAGDKFTFKTYSNKPSYLVHGSVTGWTAPAKVGEFYWNGKIGFKIKPAEAYIYVDDNRADYLPIYVEVNEHAPSVIYSFVRNGDGFNVTRSDVGLPTFITTSYVDEYLLAAVDVDTAAPQFKIAIESHDLTLWNSPNVIILNPKTKARLPRNGDLVSIEKTKESRFGLNMVPGMSDLTSLGPITIDQRFIGTDIGGDVPLAATSPETALLQGWIPLIVEKFDATSPAVFNDPVTRYKFRSSISQQPIGELRQQNPLNLNQPIVFEWDAEFFKNYLPLNAEANIVITDTGWNDKVNARITESVKFLIGGGALIEDWLFNDVAKVKFTEQTLFSISTAVADEISVTVQDGPFGGFMPGYDNLLFDSERGSIGSYDPGRPLDIYSLLSNIHLTDLDREAVFSRWNNFLESNAAPTTEEQWAFMRSALVEDAENIMVATQVSDDFGVPNLGMAMEIVDRSTTSAAARFNDTMISSSENIGNPLEAHLFDVGPLDELGDSTAVAFGGTLPISPTNVPGGATYDTFDAPIALPIGALRHRQTTPAAVWIITTKLKGVVKEATITNSVGAPLNPTVSQNDQTITLTFDTPQTGSAMISIQTVARVFEISFAAADGTPESIAALESFRPTLSIWLPGEPAPTQIQVIEEFERGPQVGQLRSTDVNTDPEKASPSKLFRFSFARATEGKIIVG